MAKDPTPSGLSFAVARKVCSARDIEQLACAFLATENYYNFDWAKAAKEFNGTKPDSFKRQIWVITKKIKDYQGGDEDDADGGDETAATPKTKGKGGRKRKADGENGTPAKKAKGGKKARGEDENEAQIATPIKKEANDDAGSEDEEGELV